MNEDDGNVIDIFTNKPMPETKKDIEALSKRKMLRMANIPNAVEYFEAILYRLAESGYQLENGVVVFPEDSEQGESLVVFNFGEDINVELQRAVLNRASNRLNLQHEQENDPAS